MVEYYCISVNLVSWGGLVFIDVSILIFIYGVEEGSILFIYVFGCNIVFIFVGFSLVEVCGVERLVLGVNVVDYLGYFDCWFDYFNVF